MSVILLTAEDPRFLAGFLTCLLLCVLVSLVRRARCIRIKSGTLELPVEVDPLFQRTWRVGYPTLADVPLNMADCGRVVLYAGKRYRLVGFYGGGMPALKSIR